MTPEKNPADATGPASATQPPAPVWKDVESFDELIALAEQLKPAVPKPDAPK